MLKNNPLNLQQKQLLKTNKKNHLKAALDTLENALLIHVTLGRQHLE